MTNLRENFYAVEVPEDGLNFIIHKPFNKYWHINCDYPPTHKYTNWGRCIFYKEFGGKNKYPGALQIICTSKEATNGDAMRIVKSHYSRSASYNPVLGHYQTSGSSTTFMDYINGYCTYDSPLDSLRSLLASKGLTGKNYLIIQNV